MLQPWVQSGEEMLKTISEPVLKQLTSHLTDLLVKYNKNVTSACFERLVKT